MGGQDPATLSRNTVAGTDFTTPSAPVHLTFI
jgi:hypothetical protein